MKPRFGPAGNPQAFYDAGFQSSVQMPAWLNDQQLGAYEYQCGRGVNVSSALAGKIGTAAVESDILLSIHAPYYINLAGTDPVKRQKTIGYLLASLNIAREMGAKRVVFHPGSAIQAANRRDALAAASICLKQAIAEADEQELFESCYLCPEVMGKINQLGDLQEVITLCLLDDRLIPCIDFGHLNARTNGGLATIEDYRTVFSSIFRQLGQERLSQLHIHFSRIEFTQGGEKKHHRLEDTQFGPEFNPLASLMAELRIEPVVICESDGTQAADAILMQDMYWNSLRLQANPEGS